MYPETTTQHPDTERLLASRDQHDPEVAAHLAGCANCAKLFAEASALRVELRGMVLLDPPAQGWQQVRDRLPARAPASRLPRWAGLAAAALLAVVAYRTIKHPVTVSTPAKTPVAAKNEMASLIARSRALDAKLAAQPEPDSLSGREAERIFLYEDSLAVLDARLARLPQRDPSGAPLWRRRADLLSGLIAARQPRRTRLPIA